MRSSLKISIRSLLKFQIYYVLLIEVLISMFHIPTAFRYILDVNMLFLIIVLLSHRKRKNKDQITEKFYRFLILYMLGVIAVAILRLVPFGQIFWAFRNNFFYLIFGILCVVFLNIDDVNDVLNTTVKLQIINFACGILEFFVFNYRDDFLGGMFGTSQGCNGLLNTYLVVICTYTITKYTSKKATIGELLWIVISSVILAAFAELKFFYVELVLIVVLILIMTQKNNKKFVIGIGAIVVIFTGIQILSFISPSSMQIFVDKENLLEYLTRSDFGNNEIRIARFTAIAQINQMFFGNNNLLKLFGLGFGACEDSETFSFFNSSFANNFSFLGYRNLSVSMLYLETGFVGLVLFILIFVRIIRICSIVKRGQSLHNLEHYITFVQVISAMSIICIWYNSSIRRSIAYLTFFCLSIIFILQKAPKANY